MTLVLAAQSGTDTVIIAADSRCCDLGGTPIPRPFRKLFVRKACAIATFGAGPVDLPTSIEHRLDPEASLNDAIELMRQLSSEQPGVNSLVAGLAESEPQISHVNNAGMKRLSSNPGEPNYIYFNNGPHTVGRVAPITGEGHGVVLAQMTAMLRMEAAKQTYVGPPFNFLMSRCRSVEPPGHGRPASDPRRTSSISVMLTRSVGQGWYIGQLGLPLTRESPLPSSAPW